MKDFCHNTAAPVLNQDVDIVIQQIDMLLDTSSQDVLGEPSYGNELVNLLYDKSVSTTYVEGYVSSLIYQFVSLLDFSVEVNVSFLEGTLDDIMLIDIQLSRDGYNINRTYKID